MSDRENRLKRLLQDDIYSLLEMNGDVGITETIENKKQSNINDNFKKWFGNSKCVDKNGNPKVFIHRSNDKFNAFDKSKIGQRDYGWYGKGFYFGSAKQKDYKLYGKHVYKCYLRIENPFYYNEFFGSYTPDDYQKIVGYDKLGILTPQESNFLQKYMDAYNHFDSNVKLKKVPQKVKDYNGKAYDSFYWVVQYNDKTTKTDPDRNPNYNTEDYAKEMFWREHYEKYFEKIREINHECYKTRMDKFSNAVRNMGYDGIINADEYVVFEPNQIKSVDNNGNWSLEVDNINEALTETSVLNDNFWKWFNGSKIVDSEGNPQVCYHGSSNTFSIFDKELRGSKSGGEGSGVGFWFSTTPEYSKGFKHKMSVYLSIKNPKIFKSGNVSSEELKFEYDKYNNEKDSDEKYYIYQLIKGLSSRKDSYDHFLLDLYHSNNQSPIEQNFYGNLNDIVQLENKKQAYDNYVNKLKSEGYDGIIIVDTNYDKEKASGKNTQIIAFEPNQIKSVDNNGNWSLEVDNINEEKEVIEERLFPELSDRKYNELLWFTSPNMTANAYTKFFGKEMIADRIPAKYLVTLSSNDISLKDLIEKHRKLYNAKQVKPIADYKDFNDFIIDLNRSKYLSRNDKSNIAKSGAKIIKSFGDWNLYDITTWEAAKKYGSGTTWCVTDSTSDDYFKRYTNRLPFNNYQTEEDMKKSNRRLLYLINPNTDRKMAISVLKRMDYDWYDDEIEFYNEEDEFFYTYSHSSNGSISLNDDIMEKISYSGDDWPNADVVEDYGVTEDFINTVTQFIKDTYRMNKEQIVEDMEKLRQKYKQLMNIKESANNSTNKSIDKEINEVLKLSGVK